MSRNKDPDVHCRRCGDTVGPFVVLPGRQPSRRPLCEDCFNDDDNLQRPTNRRTT